MAMVSARQAAVTRNDAVTFCAGNPDDGCDGDWSAHQWIVFVDSDRDGEIDADDELKLFERFSASTVIDVSGNGPFRKWIVYRSEEHTSELQSLMRNSYAVFCLKKKKTNTIYTYVVK